MYRGGLSLSHCLCMHRMLHLLAPLVTWRHLLDPSRAFEAEDSSTVRARLFRVVLWLDQAHFLLGLLGSWFYPRFILCARWTC
jgi:hypothetical protein